MVERPEADDTVQVPRKQARAAARSVGWLTVIGFAGFVLFGWSLLQQKHANARFDRQDARIEHDAEAFRQAICSAVNEARADGRNLSQRMVLDAGEVLISIGDRGDLTAEQRAAVERYRANLSAKEAAIVAEHAADDHDCKAEAELRRRQRNSGG